MTLSIIGMRVYNKKEIRRFLTTRPCSLPTKKKSKGLEKTRSTVSLKRIKRKEEHVRSPSRATFFFGCVWKKEPTCVPQTSSEIQDGRVWQTNQLSPPSHSTHFYSSLLTFVV